MMKNQRKYIKKKKIAASRAKRDRRSNLKAMENNIRHQIQSLTGHRPYITTAGKKKLIELNDELVRIIKEIANAEQT